MKERQSPKLIEVMRYQVKRSGGIMSTEDVKKRLRSDLRYEFHYEITMIARIL